jgi:Cu-processing system permease protein
MLIVARYVMIECLRRRVFIVVPILTALFLTLYAWGTSSAWSASRGFAGPTPVETDVLTGSTMLGLSMFAALFLGAVLATFLTFTIVRGDAEQGLLQPLVVRPVGRPEILLGRYLGAVAVASSYVIALFLGCVAITAAVTGWVPDRVVAPALHLGAAVAFIALLSLVGSIFLATVANGVAVMMIFGCGLTAGLLQQIGEALGSDTLVTIGRTVATILPFEALYQAGLFALTADITGVSGFVVRLGPFGGGHSLTVAHYLLLAAYHAAVLATGMVWFERKDI